MRLLSQPAHTIVGVAGFPGDVQVVNARFAFGHKADLAIGTSEVVVLGQEIVRAIAENLILLLTNGAQKLIVVILGLQASDVRSVHGSKDLIDNTRWLVTVS